MKDLVIIGAGGFGREMMMSLNEINDHQPTWNFLGFIDDDMQKEIPEGYKILGGMDYLMEMNPKPYVSISIANSLLREELANRCIEAGFPIATIIHPSVIIGPNSSIGEGSVISRNSILSTNVKIGRFNIIDGCCSFGHDDVVEDFTSIMSQALIGGNTHIGNHCYFGLRCTVINAVSIGDNCTFGACACVVKDIKGPGTYVGVPAKKIKDFQSRM